MVLLHLQCPSGASLHYAVCHAACNSSSFLTAATVSFTPLCSFLPPFRFITPRSQFFICFKAGHPFSQYTMPHTRECTSLSQANATILTGFHSAALRHSFTSVAFSPPAAHFFCSPAVPISAAFAKCCSDHNAWHMAHSSLISPCSTKLTCIVPPPPYPVG